MIDRSTSFSETLDPTLAMTRGHRATVELVSQIHLSLHNSKKTDAFERARIEILKYVERRGGCKLPRTAWEGKSFLTDEIGARRIEGVEIENLRYWALRFDDEDKEVARRSWVIEVTLATQDKDKPVLFSLRLRSIAHGENPPYDRSIPTFVRNVIKACDVRMDERRVTLEPWFVDTKDDVDELVNLLRSKSRTADVSVLSLPEVSKDLNDTVIPSDRLARDLAGAAHVVVISGQAAFQLSNRVGREFSVYRQAVRTYRPGFNPDIESLIAHPLDLADRIFNWDGGPDAYSRFISSKVLKRTTKVSNAFKRLPSFAEVKRTSAELRRKNAQESGSSDDELLKLADDEIAQLKDDLASQEQESDELLKIADDERESAEEEVQQLKGTLYHLQQRLQSLENTHGKATDIPIPDNLDELERWGNTHLAGDVYLHNRALRAAKDSKYEDISVIYQALLLLRDYYVPMRREGGNERKKTFDQRCRKLDMKEQQSFTGNRAKKYGDTYFIRMGQKRMELDRHLKKGENREPRYCFRLYFCWDDETSQVVVGSLPSHLQTRGS